MMGRDQPLDIGSGTVAGYHTIRPLSDAEFSVLMSLICGRLAVTVSIAAERQQTDPANATWFASEETAWDLLEFLRSVDTGRDIKHLL